MAKMAMENHIVFVRDRLVSAIENKTPAVADPAEAVVV
jgi:hypothetical protein